MYYITCTHKHTTKCAFSVVFIVYAVIVPKDSQSPSKSPQRELNGHPIAKRGSHGVRGKKSLLLGQSEYRTQFKAWPIPSNTGGDRGLYGWRKQQRSKINTHTHTCTIL